MCGRVIQSSGPLRYAIVDGLNVRDGRVHNYPVERSAEPGATVVREKLDQGQEPWKPGSLRKGLLATCRHVRS
jgi:hypothetical protein